MLWTESGCTTCEESYYPLTDDLYNSLDSVHACVEPNPRNAVNRNHSGFLGYEAMMFLFGFVWGVVNLGVAWMYYAWLFGSSSSKNAVLTSLNVLFNIFVVLPFWAFLIIMPFFGGWIVVPIAQRVRPQKSLRGRRSLLIY